MKLYFMHHLIKPSWQQMAERSITGLIHIKNAQVYVMMLDLRNEAYTYVVRHVARASQETKWRTRKA